MDVVQQYSNEALFMMMKKINERNDQLLDVVQLLMLSAEKGECSNKAILQGLDEVKYTTKEINKKMDVVIEKLEIGFADLKNENRDIEQKITLMVSKLSKLDFSVMNEEIEDYYALAQSLYSNWDALDGLTRKFIPLAEYLYSKLQKYDKPDYSPVILELCRAIENEFLLKIFKRYTLDLIGRKKNKLDDFLAVDRASFDLKRVTGQFVKAISKAAKTNKPEYTLGQMNTILSIISNSDIIRKSPLIKDFVDYLNKNTKVNNLLDSKYIKNVNEIVNKYRNPSAHPEFMSIEKANECREVMPERIDYLIDCIIV